MMMSVGADVILAVSNEDYGDIFFIIKKDKKTFSGCCDFYFPVESCIISVEIMSII